MLWEVSYLPGQFTFHHLRANQDIYFCCWTNGDNWQNDAKRCKTTYTRNMCRFITSKLFSPRLTSNQNIYFYFCTPETTILCLFMNSSTRLSSCLNSWLDSHLNFRMNSCPDFCPLSVCQTAKLYSVHIIYIV